MQTAFMSVWPFAWTFSLFALQIKSPSLSHFLLWPLSSDPYKPQTRQSAYTICIYVVFVGLFGFFFWRGVVFCFVFQIRFAINIGSHFSVYKKLLGLFILKLHN